MYIVYFVEVRTADLASAAEGSCEYRALEPGKAGTHKKWDLDLFSYRKEVHSSRGDKFRAVLLMGLSQRVA